MLREAGIVTSVDADIGAMYCLTWSRLLALNKIVDTEGFISAGRSGIKQRHPAQALANTAVKQLIELAKQLGLTPASRPNLRKVDRPKHGKPKGPDRFFRIADRM